MYELNVRSRSYFQKALMARVFVAIERRCVDVNPFDLIYRKALYNYYSECDRIYTAAAARPWLSYPTLPRKPNERDYVFPPPPKIQLVIDGRLVEISVNDL